MKPLEEWVAQILVIKPDRTLDEIYHAMHGFYSKEQILTVWKPEPEAAILLHPAKLGGVSIPIPVEPEQEEDEPEED